MAAVRLQYKHATFAGPLAFDSDVTAGSLLVCIVAGYGGVGPAAVSDDVNGAWTRAATAVGTDSVGQLFYVWNAGAGPTTVTFNGSYPDNDRKLTIIEYSGVKTSADPLDTAGDNSGVGDSPCVVALTLSEDCLIVAGWSNEHNDQYTGPVTGYTEIQHDAGHYDAQIEKLSASSGANSPGVTVTTGTSQSTLVAAAFKFPGGGGSVVPQAKVFYDMMGGS